MKLFVIALILINILFFFVPDRVREEAAEVLRGDRRVDLLVQLHEDDASVASSDRVERDYVSKPVLLNKVSGNTVIEPAHEVVVEQEPNAKPSTEVKLVAEALPDGPACFTVGPFHRESKAELLTAGLQSAGFKVDWRASKERRTRGYSVYLPSYPSYEAAEAVVQKLAEHGVTDYYILTDSRRRNAISLGFFTLKAGSEKRVNRLKRMGYSPQVEVRFDEVPVFWLDYESASKAASDTFWAKNLPADNLELLSRQCK